MVGEDVMDAFLGPLVVDVLHFGVNPLHDAGDVQDDHGDAQSAAGAGRLGAHAGGISHAVVQVPVHVVGTAGTEQVLTLAGNTVVFGIGDAVKSLHLLQLHQASELPGFQSS